MDSFRKPTSMTEGSRAHPLSDTLTLQPLIKSKETQPLNYNQELTKLEELSKELKRIEERIMTAQLDCYKLNIDLVTKFDPFFLEKVRGFESDCEDVLKKMKDTLDSIQTGTGEGNQDCGKLGHTEL